MNTMESLINVFCGALWTNHWTCWTGRSCVNFRSLQISVCVCEKSMFVVISQQHWCFNHASSFSDRHWSWCACDAEISFCVATLVWTLTQEHLYNMYILENVEHALWGRAWASWYRNIMSLMSDVTHQVKHPPTCYKKVFAVGFFPLIHVEPEWI